MSQDVCMLPLSEAAEQIRSGRVSSLELTRAVLDRTAAIAGDLRCFITVLAEEAERAASARDAQLRRGEYLGPLHGIPMSVKDNIATAGIRTTGGSPVIADWVPRDDAQVVRRLRQAGAIIFAKSNLWELACLKHNEQAGTGAARNPWNLERDSGGSSSGSGSSIAAGLGYAAIGTDGGGSVRVPAAFTGVAGLKPTFGAVSRRGVISQIDNLDHVGVLCRAALDAAIVFDAVSEHHSDSVSAIGAGVAGLRLGVLALPASEPVQDDVRSALGEMCAVLQQEGAQLVDITLPESAKAAWDVALMISLVEGSEFYHDRLRATPELFDPEVRAFLEGGEFISGPQYVHAQRIRRQIISDLRVALSGVEALMLPTTAMTAYRRGQQSFTQDGIEVGCLDVLTRYTALFNLTGQPALAIPCGLDRDGMPISAQIVGRPLGEAEILRIAHCYQRATDWHRRSPAGLTA